MIGKVPGFQGGVCLDSGGPNRRISVGGKVHVFEDHLRFGPVVLNRRGDPLERQPGKVLSAASLWIQQGRRMEGDLCVWDHPPKPITRHLVGRHHRIVGYGEPVRGS